MSKSAEVDLERQQREQEGPVGKLDLITPQWVRNKSDKLAVANGCYFDLRAAQRGKRFTEKFIRVPDPKHKGKTKPAQLLDWQYENVVAPLFGWKRADGTRRFHVGYISTAKKNGKTFLLADVLLTMEVCELGIGGEAYSVATQREQAGLIYRDAKKLIKASPELDAILSCVDSTKTITFDKQGSFYRALSAEANSAEGKNSSLTIYDELHAARNRELWDALRFAGAARPNSLLLAITTAGDDPQSICYEQYEYARKVLSGEIPDDSFFAYIAEADPKDDWTLEETWRKANPALGQLVSVADFRRDFEEARSSPAKENAFRRYRLNQWVAAESRFIPAAAWQECASHYTTEDLKGKACYAGVDLSSTTDVTAVVLVFPFADGTYRTLARFYVPAERIKAMRGRLPYDVWMRQGFITSIAGNTIDYDLVRKDIKDAGQQFSIQGIGIDPYNAQNLETQLQQDGFKVFKVPQNMSTMSPITKEFERQILAKKFHHNSNPVLTWMVGCTTVKTDSEGNIKPAKPDRKSTNKIDGVVAAVMALGLSINQQIEKQNVQTKSVYEERGILVF